MLDFLDAWQALGQVMRRSWHGDFRRQVHQHDALLHQGFIQAVLHVRLHDLTGNLFVIAAGFDIFGAVRGLDFSLVLAKERGGLNQGQEALMFAARFHRVGVAGELQLVGEGNHHWQGAEQSLRVLVAADYRLHIFVVIGRQRERLFPLSLHNRVRLLGTFFQGDHKGAAGILRMNGLRGRFHVSNRAFDDKRLRLSLSRCGVLDGNWSNMRRAG